MSKKIEYQIQAGTPKEGAYLWERLEGETEKQYAAFCVYRDLAAVERNIVVAFRRYTGKVGVASAGSWFYQLAAAHNWKERAQAFDTHIERLSWQAETDERLKARKLRRAVLITAQRRIGETLQRFDFDKASAGEMARLIDVINRNLREEYSDMPEQRAQVTLVNGGKSEYLQLADKAASLSDSEIVSEYRRLTSSVIPSESSNNTDTEIEITQLPDYDE